MINKTNNKYNNNRNTDNSSVAEYIESTKLLLKTIYMHTLHKQ